MLELCIIPIDNRVWTAEVYKRFTGLTVAVLWQRQKSVFRHQYPCTFFIFLSTSSRYVIYCYAYT